MSTNYPINPRVRAYGKARIDIAARAKNPADWEKLWKPPSASYPFVLGESWKQCVEYRVDDFAAEVGFFIDILGLPVNAFDPGYAMFTSPQRDFFFAVVPTPHAEQSTPPDAFRLQFMVKDIISTTHELEQRGVFFEQPSQPLRPGSSLSIGYFRTPHGICIELWGMVKTVNSSDAQLSLPKNHDDGDGNEEEEDESEEDDLVEDEGNTGDEDEDEDEEPGQEEGESGDEDEFAFDEGEDEGEDDEDDKLVEDEDEDDDDELVEGDDNDEDEDEFDQDEYSSTIKSNPQKANPPVRPKMLQDAQSKLQHNPDGEQTDLPLEYIDL